MTGIKANSRTVTRSSAFLSVPFLPLEVLVSIADCPVRLCFRVTVLCSFFCVLFLFFSLYCVCYVS